MLPIVFERKVMKRCDNNSLFVTIPKPLVDSFELKAKDTLIFEPIDDYIILYKKIEKEKTINNKKEPTISKEKDRK